MATNGVNATNSASLSANIAGALIPGATGLGLATRAADKGLDAANSTRQRADFIASSDGAVVHNSTSAVRKSLEGAGLNGT